MVSKLKLQDEDCNTKIEDGFKKSTGMLTLDLKQKIGETTFSVGFVLRSLAGKDDKWDNLMAHKKLSRAFPVILKVPTVIHLPTVNTLADDAFLEDFAVKLAERHDKEIYFYEHFAKRIKHVHLAKIFNSRTSYSTDGLENACILMSDLGVHGLMPNLVVGINKAQVEILIKTVAEIHAISLSIPNSAEVIEKLRFTSPLDQEDGQAKGAAVENLLKLPHDYFRRHQKALEKVAKENEIMLFDSHKHFGTPPVLCHGDFWSNNVFFEANEDGTISEELYAIFDWQFSHPNTGLIDIARLILCCVNASLKLRYLDDWLRLYFESFNLVRRMFRHQYPSEMLFSFMILLNHYARVEDEGLKTALLGRMVSSFEVIRRDFA
uniref:CHK kinase-like domain-containing protein n=1 Tax=Ditylenchus dipsaci TaxID=166011 RepID=A0A915EM76_9BILA